MTVNANTCCQLCLQPAELVDSHIISEFMYKRMYDQKHRFFALSANPDTHDQLIQKGLREKLLCTRCDNGILGKYENYARRVLYGGEAITTQVMGNDLRLTGLDYAKLRLFFLSLVWRMSISAHPVFAKVSLGPHGEMIRRMLFEGHPGNPHEYGVLWIAPLFQGQQIGNWTMPPDKVRSKGRSVYRCLIDGLLYCYFVGKSKLPELLTDRFLQKDGSWVIRREKIENVKFLLDWCVVVGKAMEERSVRRGTN